MRRIKGTVWLAILVAIFAPRQSEAQIVCTSGTATNMVAAICGTGISYSNVTLTGDPGAIASFTGGVSGGLGSMMNNGVVLSTGFVNTANALQGTGLKNGNTSGTGISDLHDIAGSNTKDGIILEFDFIPITSQIDVNFQFGSEEYDDYVDDGFNDAFAFFISGPGITGSQNIALVPSTSTPVTINTINNGYSFFGCASGPCMNCAYYNDNCSSTFNNVMDGFTTVLTASQVVTPCQTYHIRLMIADGSDDQLDSWVFIQQDGLYSVGNPPLSIDATYPVGTALYEDCANVNEVTFTIPAAQSSAYSFNVTWGGTATPGTDYSSLPTTLTIPAGQTSVTIPVDVYSDGITEGIETITCTYPQSVCANLTATINIDDAPLMTANAGPDASMCNGVGSVTLTATATNGLGTITYSWDNGAGNNASATVSPSSPTTYTVTVTDQCGRTATDQVNVAVGTSPVVNAGTDASVCSGQSATLTATGAATYSWDNGIGAGNGISVSPTSTTTYTVTGTDAGGCTATDQVTISVGAATVNAGSDQNVCAGASVTLAASGASSYSWDNGVTDGTAFTPGSTATYTVTATGSGGCTATDQVVVTVNSLPAINAGTDQAVCAGSSVTLNGAGGSSYSWNNSVTNGSAFTPSSTQTYTVTGTDANGCQNTDQVVVTINPLPTVSAGTDQQLCQGQSATLSGSGATSYSWNNSVTNGTAFTPASTQTYTVTGTDANGCQNTDQVVVTVNSLPAINAGTDQAVCTGASVTLTGSGGTSYSWDNSVTNGTAFTPSSTQTYTVTGTDANGCQNTDQVIVTVNTLPTINAGTDQSVCAGGSVTLNGSGATSYSWDNSVTNGTAFTPSSTQTYTVTGTDASGCQNTDQVVVTINSLPSVNAGTDQSVCSGGSVTLSGSGASSYTWNNGATNGVAFTPSSTTTYTVTGLDANGCQNTDQVVVTVNTTPVVNAGLDQTVCAGQSVTLNASGAASYSWSNSVSNGVPFTPASTITYTVTGTSAAGCTNTDQVTVTVNALPAVNAGSDQSVCIGGSVTLNASGAASYTWTDGVTNGTAFAPGSTATYTVTGTNGNGCTNTDQVTVTVNPLPTVNAGVDQAICEGTEISLSGSGATSYTWTNGVSNNQDFTPALGTQTYTVTGTDANGCTNTDQVTVTVVPVPVAGISHNGSLSGLPGLSVGLGNTSSYATSYDWSFGNGNDAQTALITDSYTETYLPVGVHTVVLTASNGICIDTAELQIVITLPPPVIRIPNVFTPDGDNVNDQFFLDLENVADLKVIVVNRWGNVMCEYNGIAGFWDGKTKSGDLADTGTYFYTYELTGVDGSTQAGQGFVELFRK